MSRKGNNQKAAYDNLDQLTSQPEDAEMEEAKEEGATEGGTMNDEDEGSDLFSSSFPPPPPRGFGGQHPFSSTGFSFSRRGRPVRPPSPSDYPPVSDANVKSYDFRHNKMPEGVQIIGEGSLEEQADKSTAFRLTPKSCLTLECMGPAN